MKKDKKNTLKVCSKVLAFCAVCTLVLLSFFGIWYYENNSIYKICRVEAGIPVSVTDFLKKADEKAVFTDESDVIDTTVPGEYHLFIKKNFFEHACTLYIEDTIAPEFEVKPLVLEYGQTCTAEDFVSNVQDATQTTISFVGEPDFTLTTPQEIKIVVSDAANNITMKETQLSVSMVVTKLQIEAGSNKPLASDFLIAPGNAEILTDLDAIDYTHTATHAVEVKLDEKIYSVDLEIIDTIAPVFTVSDYSGYTKCKPNAEKFVVSANDVTSLTYSFETEPDSTTIGTQDVTIIATDEGGNQTKQNAKLTLAEDNEAPVIEFIKDATLFIGDSVSYKSYVKVTDNCQDEPVLSIDSANVNTSQTGTYTVTYTATDCSGNSTSQTMDLIVRERAYSIDEVNALVDDILSRIITDDMTQKEKARAIFDYIKGHIGYVNHSEKGDYVTAAYEGLTTGRGDCYVYASTSKIMLTRAGITNMDIEKIPAKSMHYWNLVDIGDGWGWYHFDTTPRKDGPVIFLWDNTKMLEYSNAHNKSHNYDPSRYPVIN